MQQDLPLASVLFDHGPFEHAMWLAGTAACSPVLLQVRVRCAGALMCIRDQESTVGSILIVFQHTQYCCWSCCWCGLSPISAIDVLAGTAAAAQLCRRLRFLLLCRTSSVPSRCSQTSQCGCAPRALSRDWTLQTSPLARAGTGCAALLPRPPCAGALGTAASAMRSRCTSAATQACPALHRCARLVCLPALARMCVTHAVRFYKAAAASSIADSSCGLLCCAVLCCAVLCCAVLCCAVLWAAVRFSP
jgi:hypothetical protein